MNTFILTAWDTEDYVSGSSIQARDQAFEYSHVLMQIKSDSPGPCIWSPADSK